MSRHVATRSLVGLILVVGIGCRGEEPPPAPLRLDTAPAEHQLAGVTVRGELPVGWSVDPLERLVAIEPVGGAWFSRPDQPIATMSLAWSRLPRGAGSVADDLAAQREAALAVFGGARPLLVSDLTERRPGVWTLVTRIEEPIFAGRWSYRASIFQVAASGDVIYRCAVAARLDRAEYWHALVDLCADLER